MPRDLGLSAQRAEKQIVWLGRARKLVISRLCYNVFHCSISDTRDLIC
jgi:hypothetical protein